MEGQAEHLRASALAAGTARGGSIYTRGIGNTASTSS